MLIIVLADASLRLYRLGGLLYFLKPCCHEGEQRLQRLKPYRLSRDEMFDTPRDAGGVQYRLSSKLHDKGVLDWERAM